MKPELPSNIKVADRPLQGGGKFNLGAGTSNIGNLLLGLTKEQTIILNARYGQRVNGIPTGGQRLGMLINETPSAITPDLQEVADRGIQAAKDQAAYIGALAGDPNLITVFTPKDLEDELKAGTGIRLEPYIRNDALHTELETQGLEHPNLDVIGPDPKLTEALKGKASFHELIKAQKNPDFAVPHHEITTIAQIKESATEMLQFENDLYSATGMHDFPRGIVMRLDYSDGGFGSCRMVQGKEGKIKFVDDKNSKDPAYYTTWEEAFKKSQTYLSEASGEEKKEETKVIVSRFLDLKDSPGISLYLMGNDIFSYGLNGQILDDESGACVGTYTLDDPQPELESRIENAGKAFVHNLAKQKGIDISTLRGAINFDLMIHGEQEMALQHKIVDGLNQNRFDQGLRDQLERYGQLDHVLDYTLAECNPRKTNASGAIDNIAIVNKVPHTPDGIRMVKQKGFRAVDKVKLPFNVEIDPLRDALLNTYDQERREDGLTILRMAPVENPLNGNNPTIGVIYTGNPDTRRAELYDIFDKVGGNNKKQGRGFVFGK